MGWLSLLKAIFGLASVIVSHLRTKKLLDAGEAKAIATQLESSLNALDRARTARRDATNAFDRHDGVPDDKDPNLRD